MEAKMKEGGNGRKRLFSPSNPPRNHVSQGILPPIPKKPTPNYLKPTISSSNEVCKCGSRHSSQPMTPRHSPSVKSPIKTPSPSSLGKKALPGRPLEKPIQPTSTSTKTTVSTKPVSNRKPMSLKSGQYQPLVKAKIARKEEITKERREAKTTRNNTTSPGIIGKPANIPHEREKEEHEDEVLTETVKKEVVEHCPHDIPTVTDENFRQNLDSDAGDFTASLEEHEESFTAKEIMDKKGQNGEGESDHLEEEQGEPNNDGREERQHSIVNSIASGHGEDEILGTNHEESFTTKEIMEKKGQNGEGESHHLEEEEEGEPNDDGREEHKHSIVNSIASGQGEDEILGTKRRKSISMDPGIADKPLKLKFQRGKVIDHKEKGGGESVRLKFRKKDNLGCVVDDLKPTLINVVLNHQNVGEKKEAAGYNDVIEQTASKLVGERRSKVKALVGAFETVITLQDLGSKSNC